jgi:hypothetical protein
MEGNLISGHAIWPKTGMDNKTPSVVKSYQALIYNTFP